MSSYIDNDESRVNGGKEFLTVSSSIWGSVNRLVEMNTDFFDNNKNDYINSVIYSKYTVNKDLIPVIPLNITKFLTISKSGIYNKSNMLEVLNGNSDYKNFFNFKNLKRVLGLVTLNYNLHGVGFFFISSKSNKVKFSSIEPLDIRYNYDFTDVILRVRLVNGDTNKWEFVNYRKDILTGTVRSIRFYANGWDGIDYQYLNGTNESTSAMEILDTISLKAMPIVPFFQNSRHLANKSVFVYADLILNVLLGFGLGNVPSSLLVKIWIENARVSTGIPMDDKLGSLGDILDVLPLGEGEKAGTLDMGKLESFKNFFIIFEALLTHISQLEGIPRGAMQVANPTRQSGASKLTDAKSSAIYRDWFKAEFDEFEDRIFETINDLLGVNWEFKNIDKNLDVLSSSADILEQQIIAVTNGFEDFVVAISKYQGIDKDEARKYLENIKKSKEEFGDLLVGVAGQPMSPNDNIGKKDSGTVWKGDVKDEKKQSDS